MFHRRFRALLLASLAFLIFTTAASAQTIRWASRGQVASEGLNALDCPSANLCVGVGGDYAAVSTNPTGPAKSWSKAYIDRTVDSNGNEDQLTAVACAGKLGCVAGDDNQNGWLTTTPTSATSWNAFGFPSDTFVTVEGIGCSPLGNCTALSVDGREMSSASVSSDQYSFVSLPDTNPNVTTSSAPAQISCPSHTCVIAWDRGGVWVTTNAGTSFTYVAIPHSNGVNEVDCPSAGYCIAGEEDGTGAHVWISHTPSAAGSWKPVSQFKNLEPDAVACPRAGLCLAVTGKNTYSSTNPTASGSWRADSGASFSGVGFALSCPTAGECIDSNQFGDIYSAKF